MRVFLRIKGCESDGNVKGSGANSYADVEQLIMQIGILGAFLLSISVAWEQNVLPGRMEPADFYSLLGNSEEFRKYVVYTLEAEAREKVLPNKTTKEYDFIVPFGDNQTLDVKQELLMGIGSRFAAVTSMWGEGIPEASVGMSSM